MVDFILNRFFFDKKIYDVIDEYKNEVFLKANVGRISLGVVNFSLQFPM